MASDIAKKHPEKMGLGDRIYTFEVSSATVEPAASVVGCKSTQIAKALSFMMEGEPVLVVAAGDIKVDNYKHKEQLKTKAKMLSSDKVTDLVGHSVGGVCPFDVKEGVRVHLDESLKRFDAACPTCGSVSSAVWLPVPELEKASGYLEWIDVCKAWQTAVMAS